jgi:hypothetical protein
MTSSHRSRFSAFYEIYLNEHRHPVSRGLHYVGNWLVIGILMVACLTSSWRLLLLLPGVGYGFAWIGHFVFERNRPATFRHPLFSLAGDWVMWWQITSGQLGLRGAPSAMGAGTHDR